MLHETAIRAGFLGLLGLLLPLGSGCRKSPAEASREPPHPSVTIEAAELLPPKPVRTGAIETVAVPGDRPLLVFLGQRSRPIFYLHGMCSEARSDLGVWAEAVSEHGTIIALQGDVPCPNGPHRRSWLSDPDALDARMDAAIAAVGTARGIELDPAETVLIGESMGASRVTALANRFPAKYTRLVLVGGPQTPSSKELRNTKAVAFLAGEKEPQEKMRRGALGLARAGLSARFWELAGATHGTYGTDGAHVMSEAVAFASAPDGV